MLRSFGPSLVFGIVMTVTNCVDGLLVTISSTIAEREPRKPAGFAKLSPYNSYLGAGTG